MNDVRSDKAIDIIMRKEKKIPAETKKKREKNPVKIVSHFVKQNK